MNKPSPATKLLFTLMFVENKALILTHILKVNPDAIPSPSLWLTLDILYTHWFGGKLPVCFLFQNHKIWYSAADT